MHSSLLFPINERGKMYPQLLKSNLHDWQNSAFLNRKLGYLAENFPYPTLKKGISSEFSSHS